MPNRKITQFPAITASEINDADLLILVSVFEVDPALRNKKITFSGFRDYLDQYYINVGEDLSYNNATISGNLGVSGNTSLNNLTVSSDSDFQAVIVGDNLTISGDLIVGTTTGTKIGTANTQKIGFWNTAPVVQPTPSIAEATFVANIGSAIHRNSTFDGYTIAQVVAALRQVGILS